MNLRWVINPELSWESMGMLSIRSFPQYFECLEELLEKLLMLQRRSWHFSCRDITVYRICNKLTKEIKIINFINLSYACLGQTVAIKDNVHCPPILWTTDHRAKNNNTGKI